MASDGKCISCGDSGIDVAWVRLDASSGLGLCHGCREFKATWDEGERDAFSFRSTLKDHTPEAVISGLIEHAKLPSFPHVLLEIYSELDSDVAGIERIVPLLESDPGLAARTLALGNSAYYAGVAEFTRIQDVVMRIGPYDLWSLLTASEVKSIFYGINSMLMDMGRFWHHSLFTACACRTLSREYNPDKSEELFMAGLLHDIGKLLLLQSMPAEYQPVLERVAQEEFSWMVENELLGLDHARVGGALFENWGLPKQLTELVAHHHQPDVPEEQPLWILQQADQMAVYHFHGNTEQLELMPIDGSLITACAEAYGQASEALF